MLAIVVEVKYSSATPQPMPPQKGYLVSKSYAIEVYQLETKVYCHLLMKAFCVRSQFLVSFRRQRWEKENLPQ